MQPAQYHEDFQRGIPDFPLDFYHVDASHPRYHMDCHWHDEFELIHVRSGALRVTVDGVEYRLHAGDSAFVAGGQAHAASPEDCVYECIVFDPAMLLRSGDACKHYIHRIQNRSVVLTPHFPASCVAVKEAMTRLFSTAFQPERAPNALLVFGALMDFFGWVFENGAYTESSEFSRHSRRIRHLKEVLTFIEQHYSEPITLPELAESVHMSPKYFCRFFRQMTRRTPIDYLNYYRVECACQELSTTEKSVTEVALDCGFNDISYFIKTFRRHKGVSPGKYLTALTQSEH